MPHTNAQPRTWLLAFIVALSLTGFADAAYLTAKHYTGGPVPCSITGGCETVMTSRWASFGGVPTAGFGVAYYLAVFFLTIAFLDSRKAWTLKLVFGVTVAGLGVSLALLYLMAFVIGSYCQYCLLSDIITGLLFVSALASIVQLRARTKPGTSISAGVS